MLEDSFVPQLWSRHKVVVSIVSVFLIGIIFCDVSPGYAESVLTQHNDSGRTGAYLTETQLTPATLTRHPLGSLPTFGLLYVRPTDDQVTSQILYAQHVFVDADGCASGSRISGTRNLMFATTMNNTVYAFDADNTAGSGSSEGCIWKKTLPEIADPASPVRRGILGTPVIDPETFLMYVVFSIGATSAVTNPDDPAEFRVASLDIRTGHVKERPIAAQFTSPGGTVAVFNGQRQRQRPGLLLTPDPVRPGRKVVYAAFGAGGSWEGNRDSIYKGWVMGFDAESLDLVRIFCTAPDGVASEGAGIWQGGAGLVGDSAGDVYFLTGNGVTSPPGNYGNHAIRLTPDASVSGFRIAGFDAKDDADTGEQGGYYEHNDIDLGAGGLTLIPGTRNLVGGGKTGILYFLSAATPGSLIKLSRYTAFTNAHTMDIAEQERRRWGTFFTGGTAFDNGWHGGPHLHGAPTFWRVSKDRGYLFHWAETDFLRRFTYNYRTRRINWSIGRAGTERADNCVDHLNCPMPGGVTSLSANGSTDGIVWATTPQPGDGALFAYDAETLRRLRRLSLHVDVKQSVAKFMPPTIANGKVFVGQGNQVQVFGLSNRMWQNLTTCQAPCTVTVIQHPQGGFIDIRDALDPDTCPICSVEAITDGQIRDLTVNESGEVKRLVTDGEVRAFNAVGKKLKPTILAKKGVKDGPFLGCSQCSEAIKSDGIIRGFVHEKGKLRYVLVDFTSNAKPPEKAPEWGPRMGLHN